MGLPSGHTHFYGGMPHGKEPFGGHLIPPSVSTLAVPRGKEDASGVQGVSKGCQWVPGSPG